MARLPLARWFGCRNGLLNLVISRRMEQFQVVGSCYPMLTGCSKIFPYDPYLDCLKANLSTSACQDKHILQVCDGIGNKKKVVILGTGWAGKNFSKNIDASFCIIHMEVEGAQNIRNSVLKCFERASLPNLSEDDQKPNLLFTVMFECPTAVNKFNNKLTQFAEGKIKRVGMKDVTMTNPATGEIAIPYGMAIWSTRIGTHPTSLYIMKQVGQENYSKSPHRLGTCMYSKTDIARSTICHRTLMPLLKPSGFTLLNKKCRCPISMGSKVFLRLYSSSNKQGGDQKQDGGNIPFHIKVEPGDSALLVQKILKAKKQIEKTYGLESLKARYQKSDRQELLSKGLIAPGAIDDRSTHHLHHRTRDITKRSPVYLSCVDVMEQKIRLGEQWQYFVKHMIKERIYVIEDWKSSLGKVESLLYDHGIIGPDDGTDEDFYKAECDAAFKDKKATLSFIIWKGRRIIHSQVFEKVDCPASEVAEVYAAIALMAMARKIGIKKLVLWTDSTLVEKILSGEYFIKHDDHRRPVFLLLRFMATSFYNIVVQYKARELMVFVDDLTRRDDISDPLFPQKMVNKWRHHLEGLPVFRVTQEPSIEKDIRKFVNDKSYGHAGLAFVLEVQDPAKKFDSLMGVMEGLNPRDFSVAVHRYEQKPMELMSKFRELFDAIATYQEEECALFSYKGNLEVDRGARGSLVVVFDACVPRSIFQEGRFTVVLATPEEIATMDKTGLENFSALSYISFRMLGEFNGHPFKAIIVED